MTRVTDRAPVPHLEAPAHAALRAVVIEVSEQTTRCHPCIRDRAGEACR